jgi:ethanolamine ammonia-lyase small subunit
LNKDEKSAELAASELPEIVRKVRTRTPARLLAGRAGAAYRTSTQLELREAHAEARDAVRGELRCQEMFGGAFVKKWNLCEVSTKATAKDEYLLRPELGRQFDEQAQAELRRRCPVDNDLQIAIGDGLSVSAVAAQVPALLPFLSEGARQRQWKMEQVLVIHHCRVGILNEIGELLRPRVAVLLIGERPGLATAESLSAYMAYKPRRSHTDAERNVISNIHARGLTTEQAAERILNLAEAMMRAASSGCRLKQGAGALPKE